MRFPFYKIQMQKIFSKTAIQKLQIHNHGKMTNLQLKKDLRKQTLQLKNLRLPAEIGIVKIVENFGKLWKLSNCTSYRSYAENCK